MRDRRFELTVEGHRIVMTGTPSGRDVIRLIRGELGYDEQLELIATHCAEHDLEGDLLDAPFDFVDAVGQAWLAAAREAALPPRPGRR
jgi:hypothetical protein